MKKLNGGSTLATVIVLAWIGGGSCWCAAAVPSAAAAAAAAPTVAAAAPAVSAATRLAKDALAIPVNALQIVRLPLGVVETVLSPLPGLTVASGISNIGRGLAAPFRLVGAVIDLPVTAVDSVADVLSGVSP